MHIFRVIVNKVSEVSFMLSGVIILLMAVMIFYNVLMRYIFRTPLSWTTEMSAYMLIAITFFSMPEIAKQKAHIKFTLFTELLSPKKRYFTEIFASFFDLFFCFILIWQGSKIVHMAYIQHMYPPSLLKIPSFIVYSLLPLGAILLSLQLLVRIVDDTQYLRKEKKQ